MRLLVCGGRDFSASGPAYALLDQLNQQQGVDVVIEGDARGADRIAGYWARSRGVTNLKFPADWQAHGRAAGPIRNQRMLDEGQPDTVLAFPGGRGTADMVNRARKAGLVVMHAFPAQGMSPAGPRREGVSGASAPTSPVGKADAPNDRSIP